MGDKRNVIVAVVIVWVDEPPVLHPALLSPTFAKVKVAVVVEVVVVVVAATKQP